MHLDNDEEDKKEEKTKEELESNAQIISSDFTLNLDSMVKENWVSYKPLNRDVSFLLFLNLLFDSQERKNYTS